MRCKGTKKNGGPCTIATCLDADGYCRHHRADAGLTDKQEAFIAHYVECLNGSEAARRAGYSPHTADNIAWENLGKQEIRSRIDEVLRAQRLSADDVITILRRHATASPAAFVQVVEREDDEGNVRQCLEIDLTSDRAQASLHLVKELRFDANGLPVLKLHDAQAAAVHLAKIAGLFIEKVEHEHKHRLELREHLEEVDDLSPEEALKLYRESLH